MPLSLPYWPAASLLLGGLHCLLLVDLGGLAGLLLGGLSGPGSCRTRTPSLLGRLLGVVTLAYYGVARRVRHSWPRPDRGRLGDDTLYMCRRLGAGRKLHRIIRNDRPRPRPRATLQLSVPLHRGHARHGPGAPAAPLPPRASHRRR